MSKEFRREDRYIVIKRSDLQHAGHHALSAFHNANHNLRESMSKNGVPDRQFVVIESDWPEYEPAWAMIEARMTGAAPVPTAGGEVEVWIADCLEDSTRTVDVVSHSDFLAHTARLTAENAALQQRLNVADEQIANLQLSLTLYDAADIQEECASAENARLLAELEAERHEHAETERISQQEELRANEYATQLVTAQSERDALKAEVERLSNDAPSHLRARIAFLTTEVHARAAERDAATAEVKDWEEALRMKTSFYDQECDAHKRTQSELTEARERIAHLERGLKFYADGDHLLIADSNAWDTCSGEPINFLHDDAGTASVEDGSIAKQFLTHESAPAAKPPHLPINRLCLVCNGSHGDNGLPCPTMSPAAKDGL